MSKQLRRGMIVKKCDFADLDLLCLCFSSLSVFSCSPCAARTHWRPADFMPVLKWRWSVIQCLSLQNSWGTGKQFLGLQRDKCKFLIWLNLKVDWWLKISSLPAKFKAPPCEDLQQTPIALNFIRRENCKRVLINYQGLRMRQNQKLTSEQHQLWYGLESAPCISGAPFNYPARFPCSCGQCVCELKHSGSTDPRLPPTQGRWFMNALISSQLCLNHR